MLGGNCVQPGANVAPAALVGVLRKSPSEGRLTREAHLNEKHHGLTVLYAKGGSRGPVVAGLPHGTATSARRTRVRKHRASSQPQRDPIGQESCYLSRGVPVREGTNATQADEKGGLLFDADPAASQGSSTCAH